MRTGPDLVTFDDVLGVADSVGGKVAEVTVRTLEVGGLRVSVNMKLVQLIFVLTKLEVALVAGEVICLAGVQSVHLSLPAVKQFPTLGTELVARPTDVLREVVRLQAVLQLLLLAGELEGTLGRRAGERVELGLVQGESPAGHQHSAPGTLSEGRTRLGTLLRQRRESGHTRDVHVLSLWTACSD